MRVEGVARTGERRRVYNLRVADFHTYFVESEEWGFSVWAPNTYADYMKSVIDSGVESGLGLGSRRFRAGSRNPNGVDGDLYALAHRHMDSAEMPAAFAQEMRQKFGNITGGQIQQAWASLKAAPAGQGSTTANLAGTGSHRGFADTDRASGRFAQVGVMMRTKAGDPIDVPYAVDLRTGLPVAGKGTQRSFPDAVSFARKEIGDYKPSGRALSKDRQELIRNITAYQLCEGHLPEIIIIITYDSATKKVVSESVHSPADFLPKPEGG